ncbi:MAG: hypothetical protein MRJ96_10960 [Nitrospirales bacterium]|nr:hypothetical protein [Nitrospira sp.]MDR4501959.1 hypothetical protein [Nitrospirales bacterium]
MPLDAIEGEKAIQLMTSRYNQREWRKKIEKMLSLPPSGLEDDVQKKIFLYLKHGLQAYKSRRADPPSWIVGGFATKEVIDRACFKPSVIDSSITSDDVKNLGVDPGDSVNEVWWDEMLVRWHVNPEDEMFDELADDPDAQADSADSTSASNEEDQSDSESTVSHDSR